ncbi:MAG: hypothetical protein ACR2QE_02495, partial [Acidimicrobiales bacterium]
MSDDELRRQLDRLSERVEPRTSDPVGSVRSLVAQRSRRRWAGRGLVAVGAAAAVGVGIVSLWPTDDAADQPVRSATTSPATTSVPAEPAANTVTELDPGPLSPRSGVALVETDGGVVVWGGTDPELPVNLTDGAFYDWDSETWTPMGEAPLGSSLDTPFGVWTGDEVVLASGTDVAAWNPGTETWRAMPPLPAEPTDLHWSGTEVIAAGAWASLDPSDGEWTAIEPPPRSLDTNDPWSAASAWVADRLVVVQTQAVDTATPRIAAATYSPADGTWIALPDQPHPDIDFVTVTTHDAHIVVADRSGLLFELDPVSGVWASVDPVPLPSSEGGFQLVSASGTLRASHSLATVRDPEGVWRTTGPVNRLPASGLEPTIDGRFLGWGTDREGELRFVVPTAEQLTASSMSSVGLIEIPLQEGEVVTESTSTEPAEPEPRSYATTISTTDASCTLQTSEADPDASIDCTDSDLAESMATRLGVDRNTLQSPGITDLDPGPLSARDRSLIIPVDDGYVVFGTYRDGDESDPLIEDGAHY